MIKLSIIIPVYNAEMTIESMCKILIELYSTKYSLDIILVNDGSRDSSHAICRRLHENNDEIITYIRLTRNFGENCAVMAGLNHATGDYCVIMDDLQNPPEDVERLVSIGIGFDVLYVQYTQKRDNLFNKLASRFNDKMETFVLRKPAEVSLSNFKIMNRFLVNEIVTYHGPDPNINAIILRTTDNIGMIEGFQPSRSLGRSGYAIGRLIAGWGNMIVKYSLVPLRIIGCLGVVLTIVGIYFAGSSLLSHMHPHLESPSEYETLMSVRAFFRGFLLLAISVVGEYVGRIYQLIHSNPQFVISKISCRKGLVSQPLE